MSSAKERIFLDKLQFKTISSDVGIDAFDCGDQELNEFLTEKALEYQKQKLANTICVFYEGKFVAYFSTCADSIRLSDDEMIALFKENKQIKNYPAIKLARMACLEKLRGHGIGGTIVDYVTGMAVTMNDQGVACRYITVDAYKKIESWYSKRGFIRNLKHQSSGDTVSMRRDIFAE